MRLRRTLLEVGRGSNSSGQPAQAAVIIKTWWTLCMNNHSSWKPRPPAATYKEKTEVSARPGRSAATYLIAVTLPLSFGAILLIGRWCRSSSRCICRTAVKFQNGGHQHFQRAPVAPTDTGGAGFRWFTRPCSRSSATSYVVLAACRRRHPHKSAVVSPRDAVDHLRRGASW